MGSLEIQGILSPFVQQRVCVETLLNILDASKQTLALAMQIDLIDLLGKVEHQKAFGLCDFGECEDRLGLFLNGCISSSRELVADAIVLLDRLPGSKHADTNTNTYAIANDPSR